jgi:hypothetical protein
LFIDEVQPIQSVLINASVPFTHFCCINYFLYLCLLLIKTNNMKKSFLLVCIALMGLMLNQSLAQSNAREDLPGIFNVSVDLNQPVPNTGTYYHNTKATLLYDNGSFVNRPGTGGAADTSVLQDSTLGMGTYGFGNQLANLNRVADDVVVDSTWTIDSIVFYGYQTGSTTTSTFTDYNVVIWDGDPTGGTANVVWGDTVTNILYETYWSHAYRSLEFTFGSTRPVMANVCLTTSLVLAPGTYFIDWQAGGTLSSGPWAVPITITGNATTGDALQRTGGIWAPMVDGGTSTPQGLPFKIYGTKSGGSSINEINKVDVSVYPNPSSDIVTVSTADAISQIDMIDATGRVVYQNTPQVKDVHIAVGSFAEGLYTLRVMTANGTFIKKLVVE